MRLEVGTTVRGTVLRVADYGAIVRLAGGQTGLIHISEIADTYVRDVTEYINESDEVTVEVIRANQKGRYELSLRQCDSASPPHTPDTSEEHYSTAPTRERRVDRGLAGAASSRTSMAPFEDRLSRFLKDSEEKQHDLKRHLDARRGRK